MNNDSERSIARQLSSGMYSDKNAQQYSNFKAQVRATADLTSSDNLNDFASGLDKVLARLSKLSEMLDKQGKDYTSISNAYQEIIKATSSFNSDAKNNANVIKDITKDLEKLGSKNLDKELANILKSFMDVNDVLISTAHDYPEIMKKSAKSFKDALTSSMANVKDTLIQLSNAFNLQKLVTGGLDLKDLSKMQGNVKISMNLDDSGFMGLQRELVNQNAQIADTMGSAYITFGDTVEYLSSIKDYSFKNYNQSIALYKQVVIGNKYLNLSSQSMSNLVKATNQLADDSYMNRQMAILSALGSDSGLAENMESLAQFSAENIAGLAARYNNPGQVMSDALVMHSVNDAYLGNNAQLYNNMMAEIMNANDFGVLGDKTQLLLAISGMSDEVHQMMRTGNLDMKRLMVGFNQGMSNYLSTDEAITSMDANEYGQWVTATSSFNNNRDAYLKSIDDQLKVLSQYDLSTKEGMEKAQAALAKQNDNRTMWEKFTDGLMTKLGIQDHNWTQLLGIIQLVQTGLSVFTGVTSLVQMFTQASILSELRSMKLGKVLSGGEGGGISTFSKFAGTGLILGGAAMGFSDAISTINYSHGGFARGLFLGTGHREASDAENVSSSIGNTAKWGMIGAGIGTLIAPGIGTAVGGLIGTAAGFLGSLWGNSLDANTEALENNTDAYKESSDSIVTKSYMNKLFKDYDEKYGSGGSTNDGSSSASTVVGNPTSNYKYRISSGFGFRHNPVTGKPEGHKGVDFVFPYKTPVGAAQTGKVTASQSGFNGGAGQFINILGVDGMLYRYYHLNTRYVNVGDNVIAGQTIGLSGGAKKDGANAGTSTGPHLHFQVQNGKTPVQPLPYVTTELFNAGALSTTLQSQLSKSSIFNTESDNSGITYRLSKESLFDMSNSPTSQGGATIEPPVGNYATSSDVDRLIDVIREVNEVKQNQKELMQMLAGQNTFVYGRE